MKAGAELCALGAVVEVGPSAGLTASVRLRRACADLCQPSPSAFGSLSFIIVSLFFLFRHFIFLFFIYLMFLSLPSHSASFLSLFRSAFFQLFHPFSLKLSNKETSQKCLEAEESSAVSGNENI